MKQKYITRLTVFCYSSYWLYKEIRVLGLNIVMKFQVI